MTQTDPGDAAAAAAAGPALTMMLLWAGIWGVTEWGDMAIEWGDRATEWGDMAIGGGRGVTEMERDWWALGDSAEIPPIAEG